MRRWLLPAVVMGLGLVAGAVAVYVAPSLQRHPMPTESMVPTLPVGSWPVAREIAGDQVRRGDIAVFSLGVWPDARPGDADRSMIKRVIAVGGDTVSADATGVISVNGKRVVEEYAKPDPMFSPFTVQLGHDEVFVAGDNRANSRDSRVYATTPHHGGVPLSAITAVVVRVDDKPLIPTAAFTSAGLEGSPNSDEPDWSGSILIGAGLVFLAGSAWLTFALVRDKRRNRHSTAQSTVA
ncbi:signal peptidase I [Actinokineospora terrae]|uniref:Signal peptidase I n=1 Tax=Actinokineospora terrae TaxID=155974 RepID=A0A1H9XKC1_9PSEU|nr:signal peptidase I [Actinokineospora terrae]SES46630.1 signal peptidase I [Actinokineospora terrae]